MGKIVRLRKKISGAAQVSADPFLLSRAGLVTSERRGRSIVYRANMDQLRALVLFIVADCCGGRADQCAPILAEILPCCP